MTILRRHRDSHFMDAIYVVFVGFCLLLLSSCAHDPKLDKQIHEEASAQPVLDANARADAAQQAIQSSNLTDTQKAKLTEIARSAQADMKKIRDQESQLRILLVKDLVNPNSSDREIDGIKKRILELNRKSNKRWLSALDEAQTVLGRHNAEDAHLYRAFMQEPTMGGGAGREN